MSRLPSSLSALRERLRGPAGRSWLALALALALGGIAAWAAHRYLADERNRLLNSAQADQVQVVVAKADLPQGARVSADSAAVRAIPRAYVTSGAVLPEHFDRADGALTTTAIKAGEPLQWHQLARPQAATLATRLAPGRRAVTIPVDDLSAFAGLLQPGDRIDLILSLQEGTRRHSLPLLQAVSVVATGARAQGESASGDDGGFQTITLDLTPQQAEWVIAARERGRLSAVLRHPDDQRTTPPRADIARLLANAPLPAHSGTEVPVLYGNRPLPGQAPLPLTRTEADRSPAEPTPTADAR